MPNRYLDVLHTLHLSHAPILWKGSVSVQFDIVDVLLYHSTCAIPRPSLGHVRSCVLPQHLTVTGMWQFLCVYARYIYVSVHDICERYIERKTLTPRTVHTPDAYSDVQT